MITFNGVDKVVGPKNGIVTVLERDADTDTGFACVKFLHSGKEYSVYACLEKDYFDEEKYRHYYKKTINLSDPGMDWGDCGDSNEDALEEFGYNFCLKIIKEELSKIGVNFSGR